MKDVTIQLTLTCADIEHLDTLKYWCKDWQDETGIIDHILTQYSAKQSVAVGMLREKDTNINTRHNHWADSLTKYIHETEMLKANADEETYETVSRGR